MAYTILITGGYPPQDGAEIVNGVVDLMRREMYYAIGLQDLFGPASSASRPDAIARS
jgi:hypothetical protein